MALKKLHLLLLTLMLVFVSVADSFADISNAAALFLRIAPGGRAGGLGESFVAIADDATATHWNPAGLGSYPLSGAWIQMQIPAEYRPLKDMVMLKKGRGSNYLSYEMWVLTAKGLVRFDNRNWHNTEVFATKTDQTVKDIVGRYFNITDEDMLTEVAHRVAVFNNRRSAEQVDLLAERILGAVGEDYSNLQSLKDGLDSVIACYELCRINWDKFDEAEKKLNDGLKDSLLTETEIDRIDIAIERSKTRFIPEELSVPYAALFTETPTVLASTGEAIWVGTTDGLFNFTGTSWRVFSTETGLPSNNVTLLKAFGTTVLIGTDAGLVQFNGLEIAEIGSENALPEGAITALDAKTSQDIYVVVNNDLYHFDGTRWRNSFDYTVVLGDSNESVVDRLLIYGTEKERELYLSKLNEIHAVVAPDAVEVTEEASEEPATEAMGDEVPVEGAGDAVEEVAEESAEAEETTETDAAVELQELVPGEIMSVPYLAKIKGEVTELFVDADDQVWIGTNYGLLHFNGNGWDLTGYNDHTVEEGQTFEDMVALRIDRKDKTFERNVREFERQAAAVAEAVAAVEGEVADGATEEVYADDGVYPETQNPNTYIAFLKELNDLGDEPLVAGQVIKVYARPNAYPINKISRSGEELYFASSNGLLVFDGKDWGRADMKGLGNKTVNDIETLGEEVWIAESENIVVKGRSQFQISAMHAKLVPELADDIFYEFLGFVGHINKVGTIGVNATYLTYGTINRTDETGNDLGSFDSYEIAFSASYGTSLTNRLKGGITAKYIYSHLALVGAGLEQGDGVGSSFAVDLGLLYHWTPRLTLGAAVTNLGPNISYVDAAQADDLPRNLGLGIAYKLKNSEQFRILATVEANKGLVGVDDSFSQEIKEIIWGGGIEFSLIDLVAARVGYHYDEEGSARYVTIGAGLKALDIVTFDFAYNPGDVNTAAGSANTLRLSLSITP